MSGRLDAELAARGLARSRTHAARLIADGRVQVDGVRAAKPAARVAAEQRIHVDADHYVSRAAHKLIAALDAFDVVVSGRAALDMGASTGGFTQVLRERGAAPVLAVDVGHDQMAPEISEDPDVHVVEGMNVRAMTAASLAEATGFSDPPAVVTGDLSFISLTLVLPAAVAVARPDADFVLLVKPQFEVGRTEVRGGVVSDPLLRARAVRGVVDAARPLGLSLQGVVPSPVTGTHGNREYLLHLARDVDGSADSERILATVHWDDDPPRAGGGTSDTMG
ncbi:TlyA family rRNA (cytidine-2'-O)-methyltransferase [Microbacterium faecale]|uniref:TlyA family rRNA (Cytidine-2'-O)-methyltransferase n=1 Tax=Microbacterium faecale TaxID=1804630 RepID=A0A916YGD8_9MICO|nr:TlyA family RNA methyltransferase [Microbacterium faecale]GGD43370.1 TlyA family rRNA (cytidine-2'-O)-methyltransferase [Microbacterium faecale]